MAQLLNPYLHLSGNAREVMEFYREVFGGELQVMTFEQGGMPVDGQPDLVMHARLDTAAGFTIMASDTPPGHEVTHGSDVSVSLTGNEARDAAAFRDYWAKLKEGGTVHQELELAPWGDYFGACNDRFGTSWLVDFAADAQ